MNATDGTYLFRVYKARDGWRWRLGYLPHGKANIKIIADSGEGYASRKNCILAIGKTRRAAWLAKIEEAEK